MTRAYVMYAVALYFLGMAVRRMIKAHEHDAFWDGYAKGKKTGAALEKMQALQ